MCNFGRGHCRVGNVHVIWNSRSGDVGLRIFLEILFLALVATLFDRAELFVQFWWSTFM